MHQNGTLHVDRVPLFVASSEPRKAHALDGLIGSNIWVLFHHVTDFGAKQLLLPSKHLFSTSH